MKTKFYTLLAYTTLLLDGYLILASQAVRMMKVEYSSYLPLFEAKGFSTRQHTVTLAIATWTAVLAVGCLKTQSSGKGEPRNPAVSWFFVVILVAWLVNVVPVLITFAKNLYLRGL